MRTTLDRTDVQEVAFSNTLLRFDPDTSVTLLRDGNEIDHVVVPGLASSDYVEMWFGNGWGCLVGLKGHEIVGVWPASGRLRRIGSLERLELKGYDPGGLDRVDFVGLPGDDVLVIGEVAIARVTSDGNLSWQRVHDRLTAHFVEVTDDVAWFRRRRPALRLSS